MGKVTTGNRLYFYQLLSEKIGVGKQVLIPRVDEVLAAEDIEPADLEFETTADLLAAMPEIVKLTVFKKGRVYATLIANEEFEGILERLAAPAPAEKAAKGGAKSWKKKKGPKDPTPAKPRKRVVAAAPEPEPEPEPEPKPVVEVVSEVPSDVLASEDEAAECPPESSETPVEEAPEPEPEPEPVQPEPTISLTITYDPYEGTLNSFDAVVPQPDEEPLPKPEPATAPEPQPNRGLPGSFENDVLIKDALLRVLSLLLPFDANVAATLDEDWRYACSCGLVSGTRTKASFPLRFLHEDGSPVEVTIKHTTKTPGGKSWAVALVDGDDGTGSSHEAAGLEGLPTADEGAWSDLSGSAHRAGGADPVRELASFAQIGSWDATLGTLATMAAPERWNYPGEGVGKASRYGILREYLAVTFHRIMAEGSLAAFDTGLLTPFAERIYAVLTPLKGAIPWKLGFAVAGSGDLGMRLAASFDPLPEPARYLSRLEDVVPQQGKLLIIDTSSLLSSQLGRFPRSFISESLGDSRQTEGLLEEYTAAVEDGPLGPEKLTALARSIKAEPGLYRRMGRTIQDAVELALRRAQASYRIAAPVYDPADDSTKLLVPLCLVDDRHVDCAAVLALMPSGAYQVSAVISLERAYACARAICAEMPSWLG